MEENSKARPDRAWNTKTFHRALYAICALLVGVDLFVVRHGHFAAEAWVGFYAWYASIACAALVLIARGLRMILGRKDDYYD